MSDKELSYNCRLELSKNDLKTSTQIGLPYHPARMSMNEKKTFRKIPKLRMERAFRVDTVYTPQSGYKTTYNETFKIPVQDDFVINAKMLKLPKEYSKAVVARPLSYGMTEYKEEYPMKTYGLPVQGINLEKLTTFPMDLRGRDQRDPLPLTHNYGKYLDIYVSTSRLDYRAFTPEEHKTIAAKNIVTYQETMGIPKGRGFGCRFQEFAGQDLDNRDTYMIDKLIFKTKAKCRFLHKLLSVVPNFGSESVTQASYKRPEGVALVQTPQKFAEVPQINFTVSTKQAMSPPGMYTTEMSAINNHTSPQSVV